MRKTKAMTRILAVRLLPPRSHEVLANKKIGFQRLQDYVFSQGFCMAIAKNDVSLLDELRN